MANLKSKKSKNQVLAEGDAAEVLRKFRQIFNAVKNHFQQVEKKVGVGGAQVWALSLLNENTGIGVNDLSNLMDIHQSTASNLVKSLVSSQFIEVRKSSEDKRTVALHINSAGKRILKKAPAPFSGVLPHALLQLDPKVLSRLRDDLSDLLNLLEADESAAKIPLANL
jgi:DNA-binding MarR family transcriptional regulator